MSKSSTNGCLLVVLGLDDDSAVTARAMQVAQGLELGIYLLSPLVDRPVAVPMTGPMTGMPAASAVGMEPFKKETQEIWQERARDQLADRLAALRRCSLQVEGHTQWAPTRAGCVLDTIKQVQPGWVMTAARDHGKMDDIFMSDDEIDLIRLSPVPLWLVRPEGIGDGVVLAAVDPTHEHGEASMLDDAVLHVAREVTQSLKRDLHAVHTFAAPSHIPSVMDATAPDLANMQLRDAMARHVKLMNELAMQHGIAHENTHVVEGDPVDTIDSLTRSLDVGLIVMGALSRSRIKRRVIGSTAERLLRTVEQDVLIVNAETAARSG